jgi:hypothetical protein
VDFQAGTYISEDYTASIFRAEMRSALRLIHYPGVKRRAMPGGLANQSQGTRRGDENSPG